GYIPPLWRKSFPRLRLFFLGGGGFTSAKRGGGLARFLDSKRFETLSFSFVCLAGSTFTSILNPQEVKNLFIDFPGIEIRIADLVALTDLENLSVTGAAINHLPDSIAGWANLKELDASMNNIEALPNEIGKLASLKTLWMHGNAIPHLPSSMRLLRN